MKKVIVALLILGANNAYSEVTARGADGPAAVSDLLVSAMVEKAENAGLSCDSDSQALAKILSTKNKPLLESFKKKQVKDFFGKLGISLNAKKVFDAAALQAAEELCSDEEPIDEEEPLPDDDTIPE